MDVKHRAPGLFPGFVLVSVGLGLLARELGYLPPHVRLVDFWPLTVMFFGFVNLFRRRGGLLGALFSLAFIAFGGALLGGNLGLFTFPAARLWPGLLVLLGIAFLLGGARRHHHGPPWRPAGKGAADDEASNDPSLDDDADEGELRRWDGAQTSGDDRLNKQITFAGAQFRIESEAWQGGELGVTAGGVEIDLRHAQLDPAGARLDLRVLMGGVDIRVPDTWQVRMDVTPLFGGADDNTRSAQGSSNAPRLRITGTATLGGVNVRN